MTSQEAKKIADNNFHVNCIQPILNTIKLEATLGKYNIIMHLNETQVIKLSKLEYKVDKIDHECSIWCNCKGRYDNKYVISWDH